MADLKATAENTDVKNADADNTVEAKAFTQGQLAEKARALMEKKDATIGEVKEAMAKMEKDFNLLEDKNQECLAKLKAQENLKEDMEAKMTNLETAMAFQGDATKANEEEEAVSKFFAFLDDGDKKVCGDFGKKYYRTDVMPEGGVFCPPQHNAVILKIIQDAGKMRPLCRAFPLGAKSMTFNKRTALIEAEWEGEGKHADESQSLYGQDEIPARKLTAKARITIEMRQDSTINILNQIAQDVGERFSLMEGTAFVKGNGVRRPEGVMVNADIPSINAGSTTAVTLDNLASMIAEMPETYQNLTFMMNRKTVFNQLAVQKSTAKFYWGDPTRGIPNTIWGIPYVVDPNMDNVGADNYPVILGDFKRGYWIVNRTQILAARIMDENMDIVVPYVYRVGGQVVDFKAFEKLKSAV